MKRIVLFLLLGAVNLCASAQNDFHATWISTVGNIDWPSRQAIGQPTLQRQEMCDMLDSLRAIGINAVIFQIRPTADAMYRSQLEPWSGWLTGKQGTWGEAPEYDPLAFTIQQAHQRGMAVHVWLNPYRITNGFGLDDLAKDHIYFRHPEWFWRYGKQWYFEPGLDETRKWLCDVVADVISRYDVQGIHMDDYFYPYHIEGEELPDSACFAQHPRGYTDIEEWRRNNVNMAIREIHETIQRINPQVEFGISPFGVWRNQSQDLRGSDTREMTNYDDLYADILLWMQQGWITYVCPQLYWYIGQPGSDYAILVRWWSDAARQTGCKLLTGMAAYKQTHRWENPHEIIDQLQLNRTIPEVRGEVYFSTKALLSNPYHLCDSLRTNYYINTLKH